MHSVLFTKFVTPKPIIIFWVRINKIMPSNINIGNFIKYPTLAHALI